MDKAKNKNAVEKYLYLCFEHKGILYVPDYEIDAWVGPGSNTIYSKETLYKHGAKPKHEALWKRLRHFSIEMSATK